VVDVEVIGSTGVSLPEAVLSITAAKSD